MARVFGLLFAAVFFALVFSGSANAVCICEGGVQSASCKACGTASSSSIVSYTVKPGQQLSEIASECGVDVETIKQANSLGDNAVLQGGQLLQVPGGKCGYSAGSAPATGCDKSETQAYNLGGKYAALYRQWLPVLTKLANERVGNRCYRGYDLVAFTSAIATKESSFGTYGKIFTGCGKPPVGQTVSDKVLYTQELQAKCTVNLLANGLDGRNAIGAGCGLGNMDCLLAHYVGTGNKQYPIQVKSYAAQYRSLG